MSDIVVSHDCAKLCEGSSLVPKVVVIAGIKDLTHDVRLFTFKTPDGEAPFDNLPGQLGMFSVPPFGECMFCITSRGDDHVEMAVKKVGVVTEQMHKLKVGDQVGLRGPYGNWFPYESTRERNMLFIAGGIGMAPVRAFLEYCLKHREDYGRIDLVYSASTYDDLVFKKELFETWPSYPDTHVHVSLYHGNDEWTGPVSYTAPFLEEVVAKEGLTPENTAVTLCGGPSLFRTCRESLNKLGYDPANIITTLEARMKCGVGKCGRCNIGGHYICLDGPVFTELELADIPRDL